MEKFKGYRTIGYSVIFALAVSTPELLDLVGYEVTLVPELVQKAVLLFTPPIMAWLRAKTDTPVFKSTPDG